MLHLETVDGQSFAVLKKMMLIPELQDFCLVGGTSLSLMYGHRISEDLDLFSKIEFENEIIITAINKYFNENFQVRTATRFGIFGFIDSLKIDIVRFPHPLIRPTIEIEGVRMFSMEDIVAMKVQAILG
jgi:Nucleotidyl transferase AbiEii toxin, Type IV TA system